MNEFILNLKKSFDDVCLFPHASIDKIDFISTMLKNDSFASIPNDYYEFLIISDGIILHSLELYGVEKHNRESENYHFPNLVDANDIFKKEKNPFMLNMILLGYWGLFAIIYDNNNKLYKLVDRKFFKTFISFKSLYEIFNHILNNIR